MMAIKKVVVKNCHVNLSENAPWKNKSGFTSLIVNALPLGTNILNLLSIELSREGATI